MAVFVKVRSFLRNLFLSRRVDADLDQEVLSHLEMLTDENIRAGMPPKEAQRAARIELGGIEQVKEEVREQQIGNWLRTVISDCRYGLRQLRKNPGFATVAVLTLALGIGANTAMFSVVDGVLLRPLPYRDPGSLTIVWEQDDHGKPDNVGYATYLDWKTQNRSFQELALYSSWQPIMQIGEPEQLSGLRVTSNYFRTLGIHVELGRDFLHEEDNPASLQVVILSHALWARKFNSDPNIVGKSIAMNATSYLVAGVLPASYQSLMNQDPRGGTVEIWRVLGYDVSQPWACRTCHHLVAIGRLRAGVSFAQAKAEMDTISAAIVKAYPKEYSASGVILTPLREQLLGEASTPLYILLGAVSFVLLVACANLANLLLSRSTNREREIAVRRALGASRGRIVRQLLAENCVLALLGAAVGLIPAYMTPRVIAAVGTGNLPRLDGVRLDWRVLTFTALAALLTGIFSGLVPAYRLSKTDVHESLKKGVRGSSSGGSRVLHGMLMVSEVALSLTLLIGAGLLLRSLAQLLTVAPGFDPTHVLTLRTSVLGQRYSDNAVLRQYFKDAVEHLRALPGVQAAAAASQIPLGGNMDRYGFHPEGKINANPELDESAERYCISPGFLATLRIPLLRGRDIASTDTSDSPGVILINETIAKLIWPGEDPLGKRVKVGGLDHDWLTVIGVVGSVHHEGLDTAPDTQMYIPHTQWPYPDTGMTFVVRTAGAPSTLAPAAREAIHSLDATQPLSRVMPLEDYVALSVQGRRFALILIGAFATLALLLSVVGIYGVTAYSVAQRTHEIGIRMALGAQRSEVMGLVLRQGMALIVVGSLLGVAASLGLTRFLGSLLFDVTPTDPTTFALVVALLIAVAALACWIPARRATRVDPMVALRYE
ncbi:MAG TPA: ABC transporter permease [Candidatus Acidoferrum sp.]|jgi:putative ABC transport system permease protein|nr:ABC transporter permease [Candidatus Acidoferrum sp.]